MRSLLFVFSLAITACGPIAKHDANDPQTASGEKQEMVCHDESDTGSLQSHRVCQPRNHSTSDDDKKDTELLLGKPRNQPSSQH